MNEMKKLITLAISGALVAIPAVSMAATVNPENQNAESPLSITSVDIKTNTDDTSIAEDCVKFTVTYTGTLDAETKQQTVLGLNSNANLDDPAAANIVWIDQDAQSGTIEFLVKKSKLKANLYLKVGGTDIEIPQLITLNTADYSVMPSYEAPAISVGDVTDGDANIAVTYPDAGPASWSSIEDVTLTMDAYKAARKTINVKDASGKAVLTQTADFDAIVLDVEKMDAALADGQYAGTFTLEIIAGTDDYNFAAATATFTYTSETKKEAIAQAEFEAAAKAVEIVTATEDKENAKYVIAIATEKDGYAATIKSVTVDGVDVTADVVAGSLDVAQDAENSKAVVVVYDIAKDGRTVEVTKNITVSKIGGGEVVLDETNAEIVSNDAVEFGGVKLMYTIKMTDVEAGLIPKAFNGDAEVGTVFYAEQTGKYIIAIADDVDASAIALKAVEGAVEEENTIKLYGDVGGDEVVDGNDEFDIALHAAELSTITDIKKCIIADVTADGIIDGNDEFAIALFAAELSTTFDVLN